MHRIRKGKRQPEKEMLTVPAPALSGDEGPSKPQRARLAPCGASSAACQPLTLVNIATTGWIPRLAFPGH